MANNRQMEFITHYVQNPTISIKACAESLGIPCKTVYQWKYKNVEGFNEALDKALAEKWRDAKFMASSGMFALAENGDFKALKYILDYSGYEPAKKIDASVEAKTTIKINIDEEGANASN